jgi:hypothetical protein
MGIYVTRTLKSNYHVQTYIKDNMDNKINFMSRILAEHDNFNRVEFRDALWNSVLRPSISASHQKLSCRVFYLVSYLYKKNMRLSVYSKNH